MPLENSEQVKSLALDLRTEEPRDPSETLGGFPGGLRALDKCRATLAGTNGEFQFNCPMDQRFFRETGIDANAFKAKAAEGAGDQEMDAWVKEHARQPAAKA